MALDKCPFNMLQYRAGARRTWMTGSYQFVSVSLSLPSVFLDCLSVRSVRRPVCSEYRSIISLSSPGTSASDRRNATVVCSTLLRPQSPVCQPAGRTADEPTADQSRSIELCVTDSRWQSPLVVRWAFYFPPLHTHTPPPVV